MTDEEEDTQIDVRDWADELSQGLLDWDWDEMELPGDEELARRVVELSETPYDRAVARGYVLAAIRDYEGDHTLQAAARAMVEWILAQ